MEFVKNLLRKLEPNKSLRAKCEAGLEFLYTPCLNMETVVEWNRKNCFPQGTPILAFMEDSRKTAEGIYHLRNSIVVNHHSVKDRIIYAINIEPTLLQQLEEGNGYVKYE